MCDQVHEVNSIYLPVRPGNALDVNGRLTSCHRFYIHRLHPLSMHFFGDTSSFEHAKPVTRIAPGTAACGGLAQSSMCSWIPKIAGRPGRILQLRCVGAPWQPMKIAADRRSQVKFSNLFPFLLLDVKRQIHLRLFCALSNGPR